MGDARLNRACYDIEQGCFASAMPLHASEASTVSPAPVSVHDDGHMAGYRSGRKCGWVFAGPIEGAIFHRVGMRIGLSHESSLDNVLERAQSALEVKLRVGGDHAGR